MIALKNAIETLYVAAVFKGLDPAKLTLQLDTHDNQHEEKAYRIVVTHEGTRGMWTKEDSKSHANAIAALATEWFQK